MWGFVPTIIINTFQFSDDKGVASEQEKKFKVIEHLAKGKDRKLQNIHD